MFDYMCVSELFLILWAGKSFMVKTIEITMDSLSVEPLNIQVLMISPFMSVVL